MSHCLKSAVLDHYLGLSELLSYCCGKLSESEKDNYELLCKDNTRAPIDSYKSCYLGRAPAHAVVSRNDPQLAELIWNSLDSVQVRR